MPFIWILLLFLWLLEPRTIRGCSWSSSIAQMKCKEYYDMARMWRTVFRRVPESLEEMQAPLRPGEEAFAEVVEDPWGSRYVLERVGDDVRVLSLGPDGRRGTGDDIAYPELTPRTGP